MKSRSRAYMQKENQTEVAIEELVTGGAEGLVTAPEEVKEAVIIAYYR